MNQTNMSLILLYDGLLKTQLCGCLLSLKYENLDGESNRGNAPSVAVPFVDNGYPCPKFDTTYS